MNIKDLFRWIAVLPASAVAATMSIVLLVIITLIGDLLSGDLSLYLEHPEIFSYDHFFMSFIIFAAFGYVFVYTGAAISPKYKRIVAFVLFAIIAVTVGFFMVLAFILLHLADSWRFLVGSIICILAAGFTAFSVEKDNI